MAVGRFQQQAESQFAVASLVSKHFRSQLMEGISSIIGDYNRSSAGQCAGDLEHAAGRMAHELLRQLLDANKRFSPENAYATVVELLQRSDTFLIILLIGTLATAVIAFGRERAPRSLLLLAEAAVWLMVGLPYFLPFAEVRFFYGLIVFASVLSLHARVCEVLYQRSKGSVESKADSSSSGSDGYTWRGAGEGFLRELFNTHYFNLLPRIPKFCPSRLPSINKLLYWAAVAVLVDTCVYLMKEWIPQHISSTNQTAAVAVVGGVWVLYSMDFCYCFITTLFDLYGAPLPLEMRHKHPLLSVSLAEFWGIRWNPIVGKQLQDSFYKPLRRLGVRRALCMISCFTGSALLHAIPQYVSTRDWQDCMMMFGFFFLQGVGLLLELLFRRLLGAEQHTAPPPAGTVTPASSSVDLSSLQQQVKQQQREEAIRVRQAHANDHSAMCKGVRFQFTTEVLLLLFLFSLLYSAFEAGWTRTTSSITFAFGLAAVQSFYIVRQQIEDGRVASAQRVGAKLHAPKRSLAGCTRTFLNTLLGWCWTVSCIVLMLPLFSLPVLHACESLYASSFIVGAVLRTGSQLVIYC